MKKHIIPGAIIGYFLLLMLLTGVVGSFWATEEAPREQPTQPINFPHPTHAGKLAIDCKFCHKYVDRSIYASIPNTNVCMTCHQRAATDRPEVKKLIAYHQKGEQVPWKVIHRLPDWVYFSHKRHIKAGIECSACHGDVARMNTVRKVRSLTMGFCVSCHKAKKAPRECWTCHK